MAASAKAGLAHSDTDDLSSPPSGPLSAPSSPPRSARVTTKMSNPDEIVVWPTQGSNDAPTIVRTRESPGPPGSLPKKYGLLEDGQWVQLTAAGVPRKKPGRKPGTAVKPRADSVAGDSNGEQKVRKPRKPRDPNAPPSQRKRKAPSGEGEDDSILSAADTSIVTSHPHNSTHSQVANQASPQPSPGNHSHHQRAAILAQRPQARRLPKLHARYPQRRHP